MTSITLPPIINSDTTPNLPNTKQLTIVGASGAGKTRFMSHMIESAGEGAFVLSALGTVTATGGSIPALCRGLPHPTAENATDLDRLLSLLLHDEFCYLLSVKSARLNGDKHARFEPTRLDAIVKRWQSIFPDNRAVRERGQILFATTGGHDLVSAMKLSGGERTVLYYLAASVYAPEGACIFVEEPTMFLHPSLIQPLWNAVEGLRPDCTFIYNTSDTDFLSSRTCNTCIWVRAYNAADRAWDYSLLEPGTLPDDLFISLIGSRRPVIFIEGDATHSIDAKLYPLIFPGCTVRPLGSCNKVIEATRTFCDLKPMHHIDSHGIVDRDRRTEHEVQYLRGKNVMVPEVAEIENIFLLEAVMRLMALKRKKNAERVVSRVKRTITNMFSRQYREQALLHTRHKMKRDLECKADARVNSIDALELHLAELPGSIDVRKHYNELIKQFRTMIDTADYAGILRVFNHKPMLPECGVVQLLGYKSKDEYITAVLDTLKNDTPRAAELRAAIRACFNL